MGAERVIVLSTPRLVLTEWVLEDAEALQAVHGDAETMRFVRHGRAETLAETTALVADYFRQQAEWGWTKWRLTDKAGSLVGRAGFGPCQGGRELGYTIRRELWGQGFATEIALALVEWHRQDRLRSPAAPPGLVAFAGVDNTASARVLEKAGMEYVDTRVVRGMNCVIYELHH